MSHTDPHVKLLTDGYTVKIEDDYCSILFGSEIFSLSFDDLQRMMAHGLGFRKSLVFTPADNSYTLTVMKVDDGIRLCNVMKCANFSTEDVMTMTMEAYTEFIGLIGEITQIIADKKDCSCVN